MDVRLRLKGVITPGELAVLLSIAQDGLDVYQLLQNSGVTLAGAHLVGAEAGRAPW